MRICRYAKTRLGVIVDDATGMVDVTEAVEALPPQRWPLAPGDPLCAHLDVLVERINRKIHKAPRMEIPWAELESPVATPTKILAAPVNYQKHLDEANADKGINFGVEQKTIADYGVFLKAASSLSGTGRGVELPALGRRIDHELELAVVIGKGGRNINRADAYAAIAGYTIGLDMTVRGLEDRSWRKSFETFAVLGPWMVTADELGAPDALAMRLQVNREIRQDANTRDLVWDVPKLIEYASAAYTLYPGDVIMTGTPEGVGAVSPGDTLTCEIERVGKMDIAIHAG